MFKFNKPYVRYWILASRPKTLWAALSPVMVGTAFGIYNRTFFVVPVLLALICSFLFQILANFANDYFDGINKIDNEDRLGPPRMVSMGLIHPKEMLVGIIFLIILLAALGFLLFLLAGWPVLVIGLAALISALFYSGGPMPYASHALGDFFAFLFFGPVAVLGTYYVQSGNLEIPVLVASIGVGFWVTAILVVNNYRDMETDKEAGKNTLAVFLGESRCRIYFKFLLSLSFFVPLTLLFQGLSCFILLPITILPFTLRLMDLFSRKKGKDLNHVLAKTSFWGFVYSLLLSIGLVLDGMIIL